MLERIRKAIASMEAIAEQLERGVISAEEARDNCVDETAEQLLSRPAEEALSETRTWELVLEGYFQSSAAERPPSEDTFVGQVELTRTERAYVQCALSELCAGGKYPTTEDRMELARRVGRRLLGPLSLFPRIESSDDPVGSGSSSKRS